MQNLISDHHEAFPADCFPLEALEVLRSFDGQTLTAATYYLWLHPDSSGQIQYQFLYCLELLFGAQDTLLLAADEHTMAIRVTNAAELIKTAENVQKINGQPLIQRATATHLPLWTPAQGQTLEGIRLSRRAADGYYSNDALLLDFGGHRILVSLSEKEGLSVSIYE